ncbi:uncharacterized protein LOC128996778 [Macrosteles quadrilineatus]|uniref:uncharacterized protein LOC128996778 n=1 Tax=Macrosteles quadrilineatus TaxID=74068 RepID=UPI0023E1B418|nr:uncharacterized protein LOC128996778 [Macrosteles quadrilineatus]
MSLGVLWNSNILSLYNKVFIHSRNLYIFNTTNAANKSLSKQGKIFSKLIFGAKKKRKFIFDQSQGPAGNKLSVGQHLKYNKENSRRIAVLNTLFMKHISDLLVTGNIGVDVIGRGLEISRISMNPNFNQLNVFWGCNKDENVADLESVLPNVGYTLRHELSQLKVIGVVPRILFIKDKHFTDGAKVDYLLRIADFGDDHEPKELESDFKIDSTVSPQSKSSQEQTVEEIPVEDVEVMPPMSQDTFNLDHQYIMHKILKRMQKSRAIHRFEPNLAIDSDGHSITSNTLEVADMTKEERKEALSRFILSRKILREKKMKNKYSCDREVNLTNETASEDIEDEDYDVDDYVEEDFEEEKFRG